MKEAGHSEERPALRIEFYGPGLHHGTLPAHFAATNPTPDGQYGPEGFQEMKGLPAKAELLPWRWISQSLQGSELSERLTGIEFHPA
ncbi:hypothetical protein [Acidobacterium capsulatum]|uniref:Conserved domain protein n=1 Tax=Acidobacterium capsulatum (strain ATCC 51196 / DSM 11244 / BCRC 80197 / JCM 7670 / NBRC 15755 / NCIMB 13165 / 161) TaxID=240015 RepID=C1F5A9_ACIC5|nr:hypothetical protein [Acidobacterium capsulatum]ACO33757.1 conserved domain protein [Acidobacterium capsulatum ATCC 51196]